MTKELNRPRIVAMSSRVAMKLLPSIIAALCSLTITRAQSEQTPASALTGRTITAIGYPVNGGTITVDLKNTGLNGSASGQAKVEAKQGVTRVKAKIQGLAPPTQLGAEFLTYVLWAVSPEGRARNLGEVLFDSNGEGELKTTTELSTFSLFVTAEPYFAVRQPSEMLILENDTTGRHGQPSSASTRSRGAKI
jgi:hypothetical protein